MTARIGCYPGSFDPLTIAHVEIALAARREHDLARVDIVLSRDPLGKTAGDQAPLAHRAEAIRTFICNEPSLGLVITTHRLLADIAGGYAVIVMGADKWHQIQDPRFYDDDPLLRDAAMERLPPAAVAPRDGFASPPTGALDLDPALAEISSSAVRAGAHHWRAAPAPKPDH